MANMGNRQQHSSNSRGNSGGSSNGRGAAAAVAVDSFGFVFGPRQSGPCGSLPLPLPLSASACQLKSDRAKKLVRNIKAAATTTTTRGSNWQLATGNRQQRETVSMSRSLFWAWQQVQGNKRRQQRQQRRPTGPRSCEI